MTKNTRMLAHIDLDFNLFLRGRGFPGDHMSVMGRAPGWLHVKLKTLPTILLLQTMALNRNSDGSQL